MDFAFLINSATIAIAFCNATSFDRSTIGFTSAETPRGTDLSRFSQAYLNKIALRLNQRSRRTLGFETPADRLRAALQ